MLAFNVIIENPLFIIPFLAGFIFSAAGLIMFKYPPKTINSLYGYRTASSMKSHERWDFAQSYSAKKLIRWGLILMLAALTGCFYTLPGAFGVIVGLLLMIVYVAIPVLKTEKELRKRFE